MNQINKIKYLIHVLLRNPLELLRLVNTVLTTAKYRYLMRCVGKGTVVEPQTRIINSANVSIGEGCLLKEATYIRAGVNGRIVIKDRVAINAFCRIFGHDLVEIGEDTQIGPNTLITTTDHDYQDSLKARFKPVIVGKRVWIGANVTILPGVEIGEYAVIGAGAVVIRAIAPHSVAVGVPAKVIKTIYAHSGTSLENDCSEAIQVRTCKR